MFALMSKTRLWSAAREVECLRQQDRSPNSEHGSENEGRPLPSESVTQAAVQHSRTWYMAGTAYKINDSL